MTVSIQLNGTAHVLDLDPQTPLLWALRDILHLTGTKFGCGIAQCGACKVLVDGVAAPSCVLPIAAVEGRAITTIEGLSATSEHPLQRAWIEEDVPQCGYCQSGMIIAAAALLRTTPKPTDADIDAAIDNVCRCGTYVRIRRAIKRAAQV